MSLFVTPDLAPTNGKVISVKPLHPENAEEPMLVTLLGIAILVRRVQFLNTPSARIFV